MSKPASSPPMSRSVDTGLRIASAPSQDGSTQVLARHASLEGREVASLRCVRVDRGYAVECDVRSPTGDSDGRRLGPYAFDRFDEAKRFVEETSLALEYLGCDIDSDRRNILLSSGA